MTSPTNPVLMFVGLIAASFVLSSFKRYFFRESRYTILKLLLHSGVGIAVAVAAFFPWYARQLARSLGFGDNLNTLIFIGFILLFILNFILLRLIEKHETTITTLAREITLLKARDSH